MTYMNAWSDRWRGSNDLGRDMRVFVSYLHPAKLYDWTKNLHMSSVILAHIFAEGKSLIGVNDIIQVRHQVVLENWCVSRQIDLSQRAPEFGREVGGRPSPRLCTVIIIERHDGSDRVLANTYRWMGFTA